MEQIYKSHFLALYYEFENELINSQWLMETDEADEEDMKQEMLNYAVCIKKYKPKRILADTSNFLFTVSVEMQTWVAENLSRIANQCRVQRYAYIKPKDFIIQLTIEQTNDDIKDANYEVAYFNDPNQASEWLLTL